MADDASTTTLDFDRLAAWMDEQGLPGTGEPLEHGFISGGSQNEIYELERGDLHCVIRIPPPLAPADRDNGILREWRIVEALDGTDVPHTKAVAVCEDPSVLGRTFYLMGFIDGWSPMGMVDKRWPEPFDTDLEARAGLGYELARGHRAAVEGRLAGQGPPGPRPARRLPRAPGGAVDPLLRADQGPRPARHRRRVAVAGRPPADRLRPRPHARRLPVRQRDVRVRRARAARRARRLGDGHRRRPEARPRVDGAGLARRHGGRRGRRRRAT